MEQLILILLRKHAYHSSPAQGLEPVEEDLDHQGLVGEPLSSGRIDEVVDSIGILETEAEQGDVLRVV